jgi:HEAT repeat protein
MTMPARKREIEKYFSMLVLGKGSEQKEAIARLSAIELRTPGSVMPLLLKTLKDENPVIRANGAATIAFVGEVVPHQCGDVIPSLIELLSDEDDTVRWNAVLAFLETGRRDKGLIKKSMSLIERMAEEEGNPLIRASAREALAVYRGEEISGLGVPPFLVPLRKKRSKGGGIEDERDERAYEDKGKENA